MSSSRANFRDPLGLVIRMLKSGDPAARAALGREAAGIALKPLDAALRGTERRILDRAQQTPWPLVLIVGPPRSGTTLLYQVLARALPVSHFSNWSALFPHSPIAASRATARLLTSKPTSDATSTYHNYFGNTSGLAGPNDGFHIWNRWLGNDRYRSRQTLDDATSRDMRRFFDAWRTVFPRPFLNKNNRNADCVPLLASTLSNALFVRVRRDPVYIAQSLLLAREHIQGDRSIGWGLQSRDSSAHAGPLASINDVCDQVADIESTLDIAEQRLGHDRFVAIDYERLCADPASSIELVRQRISRLCPFPDRFKPTISRLVCANRRRLPANELRRIEELLSARGHRPGRLTRQTAHRARDGLGGSDSG